MDDRVNGLNHTLIMGAGLAGLSAAYQLGKTDEPVTVLEADDSVGGLARTIEYSGFRFDLGGHRFVTNDKELDSFVRSLLGNDFLEVPRSSKILLRGRYFDYPLKPLKAFFGFGLGMSTRILADYLIQRIQSYIVKSDIISLEDWVISNFGRTMFDLYFKDYSEKVWGIDCKKIDQSWVDQRIQGLSLTKAITKAIIPTHKKPVTLVDRFLYPKMGIGQITDNLASQIRKKNHVYTQSRVQVVNHSGSRILDIEASCAGRPEQFTARNFISTIPLPNLVASLKPQPPENVLEAASKLRSRDLVIVTLMVNCHQVTDQTWIYVPEKSIPFGRVHEPTNWSKSMAPEGKSLLVIEYFCFRGDATWNSDDSDLAEQTSSILSDLGIVNKKEVFDHVVSRVPNAYPLFTVGYKDHCRTIYEYLDQFENLYTAGRGGMFRYYNMDHAIQAGFDAAKYVTNTHKKKMEYSL